MSENNIFVPYGYVIVIKTTIFGTRIEVKPRPTEGEKPIERMHAIQGIKERLSR